MSTRLFNELEKRVRTLERNVSAERSGGLSKGSPDFSLTGQVYTGILETDVDDLYTIVRIHHNNVQRRASLISVLDESTTLNSEERFVFGIALGIGAAGDTIDVQVGGVQFARVNDVGNSYGSGSSIKAGDDLTVGSEQGVLALRGVFSTSPILFNALESAHLGEELLLVRFATNPSSGESNNMFPIRLTSLFPTGYRCDVYGDGPDEPATILDQFARPVDGPAGLLPFGIVFIAWRSPNQNPSNPNNPFFTYYFEPTRWM